MNTLIMPIIANLPWEDHQIKRVKNPLNTIHIFGSSTLILNLLCHPNSVPSLPYRNNINHHNNPTESTTNPQQKAIDMLFAPCGPATLDFPKG